MKQIKRSSLLRSRVAAQQAYDDIEHFETAYVVKLFKFHPLAPTQVGGPWPKAFCWYLPAVCGSAVCNTRLSMCPLAVDPSQAAAWLDLRKSLTLPTRAPAPGCVHV